MLGSMLGDTGNSITTPESQFKELLPLIHRVNWDDGLEIEKLYAYLSNDFRFKLWGLELPEKPEKPENPLSIEEYREFVFSLVRLYAHKYGKNNIDYWIDHTPENLQYFNTLSQIFPKAVFIHLIRDPRAIASSVFKLDWGPNTVDEATTFWTSNLSYGLSAELSDPSRVISVKYEEIVKNPSLVLHKICRFASIDFQSSMLNASGFSVPKYTRKQHTEVGNMPDLEKIVTWKSKLQKWEIYRMEQKIGDLMSHFNYSLESTEASEPDWRAKIKNEVLLIFGKYFNRYKLFLRKSKIDNT